MSNSQIVNLIIKAIVLISSSGALITFGKWFFELYKNKENYFLMAFIVTAYICTIFVAFCIYLIYRNKQFYKNSQETSESLHKASQETSKRIHKLELDNKDSQIKMLQDQVDRCAPTMNKMLENFCKIPTSPLVNNKKEYDD